MKSDNNKRQLREMENQNLVWPLQILQETAFHIKRTLHLVSGKSQTEVGDLKSVNYTC